MRHPRNLPKDLCSTLATAITLTLLCAALAAPALAQDGPQAPVRRGAELVEVVVPFVFEGDLRDLPRAPEWRPGDPIKEIPRRVFPRPGAVPMTGPPVNPVAPGDPLLEIQAAAPTASTRAFSPPDLNIAGQGFTGVVPPDTVGDVGVSYYIQAINSSGGTFFRIYNKTDGSPATGQITLDSLGSGACASGLGDPIVLYDELAGRWLLSEFSSNQNRMCVYISQTGDPIAGGWWAYEFQAVNFPDYPKYAVWPDAYYVGTNENNVAAYAMERAAMLTGAPAGLQRFTAPDLAGFGFQMITPADLDGATAPPSGSPAYFLRHNDDESHNPGGNNPGADFLEIFEFSVDWTTPANSSFTGPIQIPVAEFDSNLCGLVSFSCIAQPGTSTRLDPLREVTMWRNQYRNFGSHQVIVGNLATDVSGADDAGVRWFELRNTGGGWTLFQEGTYAGPGGFDGTSRWMGSAAMDSSGNIAVGYNVSSSSTFPGLRYAGRLAGDPPGSLPQGEVTLINGTASSSSNRYGDYASLNVDPVDGCTFWYTGEHNQAAAWSTRIGRFVFDSCLSPSVCGDGVIEGAEVCESTDLNGETCASQGCTGGGTLLCATDCLSFDTSQCIDCPVCDNDGVCETGEDCFNCPDDCVSGTTSGAACGNGVCEAGNGENCLTCAADCAGKTGGKPANRFCCGFGDGVNPDGCSDSLCTTGGFSCTETPQPPTTYCCGDSICEGDESCSSCALDCTDEQGAELTCDDGADNDCDGAADCADSVDCGGDPFCQQVNCSQFTNKTTCNAQASCRWDNKNKVCIPN